MNLCLLVEMNLVLPLSFMKGRNFILSVLSLIGYDISRKGTVDTNPWMSHPCKNTNSISFSNEAYQFIIAQTFLVLIKMRESLGSNGKIAIS